jgi:hypothetical protein
MKQICILAGIALTAVAVVFHHGSAAPAPEPLEKHHVDKWEYGFLLFEGRHWATGTEEVTARDWKQLAEKLKAVIPEKGSDEMIKCAVLNHLGSQGWELVAIDRMGAQNGIGIYNFKRRTP